MALASLCVLVPVLAAALLAATAPLERRIAAIVVATGAAVSVCAMALVLLARAGERTTVAWMGNWKPSGGIALGIDLVADPFAAGMTAFAAALAVVALVAAVRLPEANLHLFGALVLLFLAGMAGFALAGDLFTLFVFFELSSVAAYALTGLFSFRRSPVEGALNFAVTTTAGSVLLLTGIALAYGRAGALNLAQLGVALPRGEAAVAVGFALVAAGFLVKAAIVPFHFWLADAYTAAPAAVCVLLAGAMSELGIYGLARVWWAAFEGPLGAHADALRAVLLVFALATIVAGGLMSLAQRLLKRMLAFATVSHMGVLLAAVALLRPDALAGAAGYVAGDGLVRAGLFCAVGVLVARHETDDEAELYGRARGEWGLMALMTLGGLALAGLPPFGPFLGGALIEDAAVRAGFGWLAPLLLLAGLLTGGAVLRSVRVVFLGAGRGPGDQRARLEASEPPQPAAASRPLLLGAAIVLIVAGLAWGLVPGLAGALGAGAHAFADRAGYAATVLRGAPGGAPPVPELPPEPLAYVLATLATLGALLLAAGGVLIRKPLPIPGWVAPLRRLHSGRAGDYLAWLAVGAGALASACVVALT